MPTQCLIALAVNIVISSKITIGLECATGRCGKIQSIFKDEEKLILP